jgi:hypothetical protein
MKFLGAGAARMLLVGAIAGGLVGGCEGRDPIADPDPGAGSGPSSGSGSGQPGGNGSAGGGSSATTGVDTAGVQQELLARWNAAAGASGVAIDFRWPAFDQFPHPTFKGGTAEAYQEFAVVLLTFFRQGDDFDFLARNNLFMLTLSDVFPSGQHGIDTSFLKLAISFSSPDSFGNIPADAQAALKEFADRMQGAPAGGSGAVNQPPPDAGSSGTGDPYNVMCHNYCEALYETNLYLCVNNGGDGLGCISKLDQAGISADTCFQLRCVPRLVQQSLCFEQCDAVASQYQTACSGGNPSAAPLCPTSPADHDSACRAGCAPAYGPP